MEITGAIKVIGEVETFDSGFTKRQVVLTTLEQYPQDVALEFFKDKTSVLDGFKIGEKVTVTFNIRGSEWQGRYYVSLNGWKINKDAPVVTAGANEPQSVTEGEDESPF